MSGLGARLHLIPVAPEVGPGTREQPDPVAKQQRTHFYLLATLLAGFACLLSASCAILQQNVLFCQSMLPEFGGCTFSCC